MDMATHSIGEVIGTSITDLPRISTLLREALFHDSPTAPAQGSSQKRDTTARALFPFQEAILKSGFIPVLIELALIEDSRFRLDYEPSGQASARSRDREFLSLFCSYAGQRTGERLLLSWQEAMENILGQSNSRTSRAVIQPIVTHRETYENASYFTEPLAGPIDQLFKKLAFVSDATPAGQAQHAFAVSQIGTNLVKSNEFGVKKIQQISEAHKNEGVNKTNGSELGNGHIDNLDLEPVLTASRYPFEMLDADSGESVALTIYWLVAHFSNSVAESSNEPSEIEAALAYLRDCHLLIVPFNRPHQYGAKPWVEAKARDRRDTLRRAKTEPEPGGCLFAIIKPTESKEIHIGQMIQQLALRHSWLLCQAALLEAHSEFALKIKRQKTVAAWSHTLTTEARVAEDAIRIALDQLTSPTRVGLEPIETSRLGHALMIVRRLHLLTEFSVKAAEATETGSPTVEPNWNIDGLTEFQSFLEAEVNTTWNGLIQLGIGDYWDWKSSPSPKITAGNRSSSLVRFSLNKEQLWVALTEVLKNILQHGNADSAVLHELCIEIGRPRSWASNKAGLTKKEQQLRQVSLVARNHIPPGPSRIRAIEAIEAEEFNVGMSSLYFASWACGYDHFSAEIEGDNTYIQKVVIALADEEGELE
jgi:hypothetical protein